MRIQISHANVEDMKDALHLMEEKVQGDMQLVDFESCEELNEELSEDEKIINSFITQGISIPSYITKVCRVVKRKGYTKTSNFEEIIENSIFVDGEELVGLVIFNFFGPNESQRLAISLYNLCKTSGLVKRLKKLKINYQFMHGARIYNGEFDLCKQSVKPLGGGCLIGKHLPSAIDLDYFSNDIVNLIYKKLQIQLPS